MAHAEQTAEVLPFTPRPRTRFAFPVDGAGLDFSRAVLADDALVDRLRLATAAARDALGSAPRDPGGIEATQAERVAAVLTAMDDNPLMRPLCWAGRDLAGTPYVHVAVAGAAFRLFPDDCRLAADTLDAEQAFPGCVGTAGDLREAANRADRRAGLYAEARTRHPRPYRITGMASTVAFALMILCAAALVAWRGA